MNLHPDIEDQPSKPVIGLFAAFGWQTSCALEETFGAGGTLDLVEPTTWPNFRYQ